MSIRQGFVLLSWFALSGCHGGIVDPWPGDWYAAEQRMMRFHPDGKVDYYSRGTRFARGSYTRLGSRFARVDMASTMPRRSSQPSSGMFVVKLSETHTFDFNQLRFSRRR